MMTRITIVAGRLDRQANGFFQPLVVIPRDFAPIESTSSRLMTMLTMMTMMRMMRMMRLMMMVIMSRMMGMLKMMIMIIVAIVAHPQILCASEKGLPTRKSQGNLYFLNSFQRLTILSEKAAKISNIYQQFQKRTIIWISRGGRCDHKCHFKIFPIPRHQTCKNVKTNICVFFALKISTKVV